MQVSPGGPSPRYGAVGGRDRRVLAASVPNLSWPNTSFYLAGGIDASTVSPLSDVWRLDVTGTLSSNNLNDIFASWDQVDISTTGIPSKVGAAEAVISQGAYQMLAAVDGCSSSVAFTPNSSCAQPDSYIINTGQALSRLLVHVLPRVLTGQCYRTLTQLAPHRRRRFS